jgi:hypothetical protein
VVQKRLGFAPAPDSNLMQLRRCLTS